MRPARLAWGLAALWGLGLLSAAHPLAGGGGVPALAQAAARVPIVGYELGGARVDPDDQLQALLQSVAALGDPFVQAGPSDEIGQPLGTVPRLAQALDAVGYRATITTRPAGGAT